jgi:hypothetical protein
MPLPEAETQAALGIAVGYPSEFIAGAEEGSRRRLGRGLTAAELEQVLRRYPGDV